MDKCNSNQIEMRGTIATPPELHYADNGIAVTKFELRSALLPSALRCVALRKSAELAYEYGCGSLVFVRGNYTNEFRTTFTVKGIRLCR